MFRQLLFAFSLAAMTVIVHAIGTALLMASAKRIWTSATGGGVLLSAVLTLTQLIAGLLILHLAEMTVWAAAFAVVGVMPDFETSLYYSLESYTTVGYGDALPSRSWRLLGPVEAAVGVLMLGWSTGIIVAAVQKIYSGGEAIKS